MHRRIIGQDKVLEQIDKWKQQNRFPRFTIINGLKGSGKKMLARHLADTMEAIPVECGIKVDELRSIIAMSYKQSEPVAYIIPDADRMSIAAKNSLLKVTEEPPRQAYFIMTIEELNNTLPTITSRGTVLSMQPYTNEQILEYTMESGLDIPDSDWRLVSEICSTPGEVNELAQYDISEFYEYICKVLDNIGKVNGANAFKIGTKINFKDSDEDAAGWNVQLFLRAIITEAIYRAKKGQDVLKNAQSVYKTSRTISDMRVNGINKSATFDMWLLDMMEIWSE